MDTALKSYNDAIGSWESRVLPAGRKLEQLKETDSKDTLPGVEKIERPLREIRKQGD